VNWVNPKILYVLLLIPVFILFHILRRIRLRNIEKKLFNNNTSRDIIKINKIRDNTRFILFIIAFSLLVIAAARPRWGEKPYVHKGKGIDIVIALDVSKSMYCEDIKPNRLEMAKLGVMMLLEGIGGNRVGLVAFAGDAYAMVPLTTDLSIFRLYLDMLQPQNFPVQGTNIGKALEVSSSLFDENSKGAKVIVLFTDGEDLTGGVDAGLSYAIKKGIRIFTVGIGSNEGTPVPEIGKNGKITGYKKDKKGKPIISKPNDMLLRSIALGGKGGYIRLRSLNLSPLIGVLRRLKKGEFGGERYLDLAEKYQYFLLTGILFMLIGMVVRER